MELKLIDLVIKETIKLESGRTYTVGRNRDNIIPIPSLKARENLTAAQREFAETISRYHAELSTENGTVKIIDKGSSNGTYIGDKRVGTEWTEVQPGTAIRLGIGYEILFPE